MRTGTYFRSDSYFVPPTVSVMMSQFRLAPRDPYPVIILLYRGSSLQTWFEFWKHLRVKCEVVKKVSDCSGFYRVICFKQLADELPAQLADLSLRPRAMAQPSYSLCRVSPDDKGLVLKFLRRFFFRDEPMNLAVNLLESSESRCDELEEYAAATLEDLVSVAAVDENGDFVGIVVNGIARREEVDYTDKSEDCPNPKFRRILKVLGHLDQEARIWEKLPEDCHTVLEVRIASTHTGWRGRGLMRVLCEESERIAKSIGASAMRMDTTSAFSAAAAERLNYKQVYGTLYSDLPFAPQPDAPHHEARVYVKELF